MFRRSSYSTESGNNCVEVARTGVGVAVRDSKAPECRFGVTPAGFGRFVAAARRGRFDLP
ncbi:DUF397 domain-containing protein [Saccharothrix coeruleofusca]|uniref:DUF397 domain-containing protein n=1 Tax=Saccharothrix coeruleofusca TaxID=33919 RepID=A0A918AJB7_9PSEU|nr:DUF397 domain-containing protein [Saccharothrix coeruleofusca]GGP49464.1 hypothetical protein GCM10010185_22050 [Saccharothrix coeruleofusca]